ncbi:MAG: hypothetical protein ACK56F_08525, partial [bacterium]
MHRQFVQPTQQPQHLAMHPRHLAGPVPRVENRRPRQEFRQVFLQPPRRKLFQRLPPRLLGEMHPVRVPLIAPLPVLPRHHWIVPK